jgi:hypothetical protein
MTLYKIVILDPSGRQRQQAQPVKVLTSTGTGMLEVS